MRDYKTIGLVKSEKLKREIPVLDIPIMSDEKMERADQYAGTDQI